MLALKSVPQMNYKCLIATGLDTHHLKKNFKCFLSNVLETFYHECFCSHILTMLIKHLPSHICKQRYGVEQQKGTSEVFIKKWPTCNL